MVNIIAFMKWGVAKCSVLGWHGGDKVFVSARVILDESFLRLCGGSSIILLRSPRSFKSTGLSQTDSCIVGLKKNTLSSPVHTTHLQGQRYFHLKCIKDQNIWENILPHHQLTNSLFILLLHVQYVPNTSQTHIYKTQYIYTVHFDVVKKHQSTLITPDFELNCSWWRHDCICPAVCLQCCLRPMKPL